MREIVLDTETTGFDPETGDRLFTTLGALALASAHIVNWRLRHANG